MSGLHLVPSSIDLPSKPWEDPTSELKLSAFLHPGFWNLKEKQIPSIGVLVSFYYSRYIQYRFSFEYQEMSEEGVIIFIM